jgi:hypothetical protein
MMQLCRSVGTCNLRIGYPDQGFLWFSRASVSETILNFHSDSVVSYIISVIETESLNNPRKPSLSSYFYQAFI